MKLAYACSALGFGRFVAELMEITLSNDFHLFNSCVNEIEVSSVPQIDFPPVNTDLASSWLLFQLLNHAGGSLRKSHPMVAFIAILRPHRQPALTLGLFQFPDYFLIGPFIPPVGGANSELRISPIGPPEIDQPLDRISRGSN